MGRRLNLVFIVTFFLVVYGYYTSTKEASVPSDSSKALIVDGLVGFSNQYFITNATEVMVNAGFETEIIHPEDVTVDLYQNLPLGNYDLILLRVHCGPLRSEISTGDYIPEGIAFFTTEKYAPNKYERLQAEGLLAVARIQGDNENRYFAIPPVFFEKMDDEFENTTIILDSCYGFWEGAPLVMANTLIDKGVTLFIGWNGEVQVEHTDLGILELLKNLFSQGKSVDESVNKVMQKIGPDPYYKSRLYYYPLETSEMILKK